jgi:monoamine oxidase
VRAAIRGTLASWEGDVTYRRAEVAVIGGGAAGIAAARRLHGAGRDYVLLEAKGRPGGRALTHHAEGYPMDLGCGWLHSADINPWVAVALEQGHPIDKTPPPWSRNYNQAGFAVAEQDAYRRASYEFHDRVENEPLDGTDPPLSRFLEPNNPWNPLLNAVSTYFSGAELEHVSTRDLRAYQDSEVNWRVAAGYGTVISQHAEGLNAIVNCAVKTVRWTARGVRLTTSQGLYDVDAAIITLPTSIIAQGNLFDPPLPEKIDAAANLPLGLADKLFLHLDGADEFEKDSRLWGHNDRAATAIYHLRPFGRPLIECYFGGGCADELEALGEAAFFEFAREELVGVVGHRFGDRIRALPMNLWRADPFAGGSYSYARPGKANLRAVLASPVENVLYFAGEACSADSFSTAHGAFRSGVTAAEMFLAAHAPEKLSTRE